MTWKAVITAGALAVYALAGCSHKPEILPAIYRPQLQEEKKCTPIGPNINLEAILQKKGLDQGAYLFENALDEAVKNNRCMESLDNPKIPKYLLAEQDWTVELDKETHKGFVYQQGHALMELDIATGGYNKDHRTGKVKFWPTPSGTYYINRIVMDPFYYHPGWSGHAGRVDKPGKKNPYGTVMMELCNVKGVSNYNFFPPGHIGINFHSTGNWKGPGNRSHGCIRGYPPSMEELAPAIIYNFTDGKFEKNGRGTIYILNKPITVHIH